MKVIFTGGGTGGHVVPNIAIINKLKEKCPDVEIVYVGSKNGIEKELIEKLNIRYLAISTGKFRRHRWYRKENIKDAFNVIKGLFDAKKVIKSEKPDLVFSKGGYVAVPSVIAAKKCKVPVIIHESDITPGLANKISFPYAKNICVTFPETYEKRKNDKYILTGSPIRDEIFKGDKKRGLEFLNFNEDKKVLLVMGGSLGADKINKCIRENIDELLKDYQIVNLCGKGKICEELNNKVGIKQYEYISEEMPDIFAASDIIISRAGAGSIYEILALAKPNILIPLSKYNSRGDQILNAESFKKQGFSVVISQDDLTKETLFDALKEINENKEKYISKMKETKLVKANDIITDLIISMLKKGE